VSNHKSRPQNKSKSFNSKRADSKQANSKHSNPKQVNSRQATDVDSGPVATGVQLIEVLDGQEGQRLDNYLLSRLKGVPKSRIYRLLRKGEIRVNKGRVKPDRRVAVGDIIRVAPLRMSEKIVQAGPSIHLQKLLEQSIVYEDEKLLVVNKPSGLAVHGGSGINLGLIESLRAMRPDARYLELVHRLDRDTSGCVMIAKKRSALLWLQNEMRARKIDKTYLALACGRWPKDRKRIDAPLRKIELASGERIVKISVDGKPSITHFKVLTRYQWATLLEVGLETGRTHQIRVHSQFAGHPLAQDEKYGDAEFNRRFNELGLKRMFLHAFSLDVRLPPAEGVQSAKIHIEAPLPVELEDSLQRLERLV
jgi:23S rRNA pseudouridine955/2504/2580 synthase